MNYMHECDRLQSENARLRQEALMSELEIRNLRAAIRSKKCDKCGSCAVRFEIPAPELPRKVEPGTTLTVGARYRITEVASWDRDPVHSVGDELGCCPKAYRLGGLEPEWDGYSERHHDRGHWVAHTLESCTYVTGLELVAEAPKGKP